MGWTGIRNGDLLKLEHQQNLGALPIAVVILVAPTNRIESLQPLGPALLQALETLAPRQLIHVGV
jgi:hypothetical protein